ncbi:hypothetical protein P4234_14310 [Pseudomonas aeruginosa]|nr:hypothetical protein [Pseudomonas aeruginosa]
MDSAAEHVVAPPLDAPEAHLYRQDIDFYALLLALQHGANARHHTRIEGFEFLPEGVAIRLADGESLQARYVIDAAAQDRRSHVNWACAPPMAWQPTPAPSSPICST